METNELHEVRVRLDGVGLMRMAAAQGLSLFDLDMGYAVHAWSAAMWRACGGGFKPFHVAGVETGAGLAPRAVTVVGYDRRPAYQLATLADRASDAWSVCDWREFASVPVETARVAGARVGFTARVCPVSRNTDRDSGRRVERDAFVAACMRAEREGTAVPSRDEVYLAWVGAQLATRGARLVRGAVTAFSLERVSRSTHGAGRRQMVRPDVTVAGEVEMFDSDAYAELLARGIGRHRAFGFGMLRIT